MTRWMIVPTVSLLYACADQQETAMDCLGRPVSTAPIGAAELNWDAPTSRTDGSPLADLSGYKIYYGIAPDQLRCQIEIRDPKATNANVTGLSPGTWYFAVVSVDNARVESKQSDVVSKQID